MVNTRMIYVRVTRDQHERIRNNCRIGGFESVSSYIRFMAIDPNLSMQQRIFEIHEYLLGTKRTDRVRPKEREAMD